MTAKGGGVPAPPPILIDSQRFFLEILAVGACPWGTRNGGNGEEWKGGIMEQLKEGTEERRRMRWERRMRKNEEIQG